MMTTTASAKITKFKDHGSTSTGTRLTKANTKPNPPVTLSETSPTFTPEKETQTSVNLITESGSQTTAIFDTSLKTGSSSPFESSVTTTPSRKVTPTNLPSRELSSQTDNSLFMMASQYLHNRQKTSSLSSTTEHSGESSRKPSVLNNPSLSFEIFSTFPGSHSTIDFTNQKAITTTNNIEKTSEFSPKELKSSGLKTSTLSGSYNTELKESTHREVSNKIEYNLTEKLTLATRDQSEITTPGIANQSVHYKDDLVKSSTLSSEDRTDPTSSAQPLTDDDFETTFVDTLNGGQKTFTSALLDTSAVPNKTESNTVLTTKARIPLSIDSFSTETLTVERKTSGITDKDDWKKSTHMKINSLNNGPLTTTLDDRTSVGYLNLSGSSQMEGKSGTLSSAETTSKYSIIQNTGKTTHASTDKKTASTVNTELSLDVQTRNTTQINFAGPPASEKSKFDNEYTYETTSVVMSQAIPDLTTEKMETVSSQPDFFTSKKIFSRNTRNLLVIEETSQAQQNPQTSDVTQAVTDQNLETSKILNESKITISTSSMNVPSPIHQSSDLKDMSTVMMIKDDVSTLTGISSQKHGTVSVTAKDTATIPSLTSTVASAFTTENEMVHLKNDSFPTGPHSGEKNEVLSTDASDLTRKNLLMTTAKTFLLDAWKTDNFQMSSVAESSQTKRQDGQQMFSVTQDNGNMGFMEKSSTSPQSIGAHDEGPWKTSIVPDITKREFSSRPSTENTLTQLIKTRTEITTTESLMITGLLSLKAPSTGWKNLSPSSQETNCSENYTKMTSAVNEERRENYTFTTDSLSRDSTLSQMSKENVSASLDIDTTYGFANSTPTNSPEIFTSKAMTTRNDTIHYPANLTREHIPLSSTTSINEIPGTISSSDTMNEITTGKAVFISSVASVSKNLSQNSVAVHNTDAPKQTVTVSETTTISLKEIPDFSSFIEVQRTTPTKQSKMSSTATSFQESTSLTSIENTTPSIKPSYFPSTQWKEKTSEENFPSFYMKSTSERRNSITELLTTESLVETNSKKPTSFALTTHKDLKVYTSAVTLKMSATKKTASKQELTSVATQEESHSSDITAPISMANQMNTAIANAKKQTTMKAEDTTSGANAADGPSLGQPITRNEITSQVTLAMDHKPSSAMTMTDTVRISGNSFYANQEISSTVINNLTYYDINSTLNRSLTTTSPPSSTAISESIPSKMHPETIPTATTTTQGSLYEEFNGIIRIVNGLKWSTSLASKDTEEFKQAEAYIRNMVGSIILLKYKT